jgi:hypothetical protein
MANPPETIDMPDILRDTEQVTNAEIDEGDWITISPRGPDLPISGHVCKVTKGFAVPVGTQGSRRNLADLRDTEYVFRRVKRKQ